MAIVTQYSPDCYEVGDVAVPVYKDTSKRGRNQIQDNYGMIELWVKNYEIQLMNVS